MFAPNSLYAATVETCPQSLSKVMQGVGRTEVVLGWGVARVTVALVHLLFLFERLSKLLDFLVDSSEDVLSGFLVLGSLQIFDSGFEFINHCVGFVGIFL